MMIFDLQGRIAHSAALRVMLGLGEKEKLPLEGMEPRLVQGVKVWVTPLVGPRVPRARRYHRPLEPKSSRHRVLAECPRCGVVLSAGRLHQHVCKGGAR